MHRLGGVRGHLGRLEPAGRSVPTSISSPFRTARRRSPCGCTSRSSQRWSLNWATSTEGVLFPPTIGAFTDGIGLFYGDDQPRGHAGAGALHLVGDHPDLGSLGAGVLRRSGKDVGNQLDYGVDAVMTAMKASDRDFRFGFTLGTHYTRQAWSTSAGGRRPTASTRPVGVDHLGPNRTSPLLAAMAAAYACDHLRVGSYVLNIGFWNPSVLARDVATLMRLTDGRLELGLGTGLLKYQFDDAGFEFQSFQQRHERVASTHRQGRGAAGPGAGHEHAAAADRLRRRADDPAGRRAADIFSLGGRLQVAGQPPATLRLKTAAETDERMKFFCSDGRRAGSRRSSATPSSWASTRPTTGARPPSRHGGLRRLPHAWRRCWSARSC